MTDREGTPSWTLRHPGDVVHVTITLTADQIELLARGGAEAYVVQDIDQPSGDRGGDDHD